MALNVKYKQNKHEPIAIVGIGCETSGDVASPATLLHFLENHGDGVQTVPADRWNADAIYSPDVAVPGKIPTRKAGFMNNRVGHFDPAPFNIAPREIDLLDPQQTLLLQATWHALEDAGFPPLSLKGSNTGVYIGSFFQDMQNFLSQFSIDGQQEHANSSNSGATMLAARIAYTFDFHGPTFSVDTACSSSLVAITLAVQALQSGRCDLAVTGGAGVIIDPLTFMGIVKAGFVSKDGRSKTFDASADGYGRGEGVGIVVLKRLSEAIRDGDAVYSVIVGAEQNSDGKTDTVPMPNGEAQAKLAREVVMQSGVNPAAIDFVECHGTGTAVGDPIELNALGQVYGRAQGRKVDSTVWATGIKSNIGHTEGAAGVLGLIKGVIMAQERVVLPIRAVGVLNPNIPFESSNMKPALTMQALPAVEEKEVVYGAVNSFGFGGSNAHVVIASAPREVSRWSLYAERDYAALLAEERGIRAGPDPREGLPWMLPVSGACADGLKQSAKQLAEVIESCQGGDDVKNALLKCIRYTNVYRRSHQRERAVVIGTSWQQAVDGLLKIADGESLEGQAIEGEDPRTTRWPCVVTGTHKRGDPVWVFTGMGPQNWAMGRHLYASEPEFARGMNDADKYFRAASGWSIKDVVLHEEEGGKKLNTHEYAMPGNFLIQVGLVYMLRAVGIQPAAIIGHSVGEIAAAWAAGCLTLKEATRLLYGRNKAQLPLVNAGGGMLAVGMGLEEVQKVVDEVNKPEGEEERVRVSVAAVNAPDSTTLAGEKAALEGIKERLTEQGVFAVLLRVQVPYHSHMIQPYLSEVRAACSAAFSNVKSVTMGKAALGRKSLNAKEKECIGRSGGVEGAPSVPLFSTATGMQIYRKAEVRSPDYWVQNTAQKVLLQDTLKGVIEHGYKDLFVEIGPHPVLKPAIVSTAAQLKISGIQVFNALKRSKPEHATFLTLVAHHFTTCGSLDWSKLTPQSGFIPLPLYPFQNVQRQAHRNLLEQGTQLTSILAPPTASISSLTPHMIDTDTGKMYWCDLRHVGLNFLKEHDVAGGPILPGAAHVEAMLGAVASGSSQGAAFLNAGRVYKRDSAKDTKGSAMAFAAIRDVTFELPMQLVSDSKSSQFMQTRIDKYGGITVHMHTRSPTPVPSMQYSSGKAVSELDAKFLREEYDLEWAKDKLDNHTTDTDFTEMYDQLWKLGFKYGPSFRQIRRISVLDGRVIADIGIPGPEEMTTDAFWTETSKAQFCMHPCTMDCAIHASFQVHGIQDPIRQLIPHTIKNVTLFEPFPSDIDHIIADITSKITVKGFDVDMTFVHPTTGIVLATFEKLSLVSISAPINQNMFAHEQWTLTPETAPTTPLSKPTPFLIIGDGCHPAAAALRAAPRLWHEVAPPTPAWVYTQGQLAQLATDIHSQNQKPQTQGQISGQDDGEVDQSLASEQGPSEDAPLEHMLIGGSAVDQLEEGKKELPFWGFGGSDSHGSDDVVEGGTDVGSESDSKPMTTGDMPGYSIDSLSGINSPLMAQSGSTTDSKSERVSMSSRRASLDAQGSSDSQPIEVFLIPESGGKDDPVGLTMCNQTVSVLAYLDSLMFQVQQGVVKQSDPELAQYEERLRTSIGAHPITVTLIGSGAHSVCEHDEVDPRQTSVWGLLRSVRRGHLSWDVRMLDVIADAPAHVVAAREGTDNARDGLATETDLDTPITVKTSNTPTTVDDSLQASSELVSVDDAGVQVGGESASEDSVEQAVIERNVDLAEFLTRRGQAEERVWRWGSCYTSTIEPGSAQLEHKVAHLQFGGGRVKGDNTTTATTSVERFASTVGVPGKLTSASYRMDGPALAVLPPGMVEVEVEVVSLNWKDLLKVVAALMTNDTTTNLRSMASGIGMECSGVVTRVAEDVARDEGDDTSEYRFRAGDLVHCIKPDHGIGVAGNYLVTNANLMFRRQVLVDDPFISASFVSVYTAYYSLFAAAALKKGDRVLIHSGTGGVGTAAVKMALLVGAEVIATAGNEKKRTILREMGVQYVYDSRTLNFGAQIIEEFGPQCLDVVVNSLTGEALKVSMSLLDVNGRFVEIGMRDTYDDTQVLPMTQFARGITFTSVDFSQISRKGLNFGGPVMHQMFDLLRKHPEILTSTPYKVYPAHRLPEALLDLSRGEHIGKLLVDMRTAKTTPVPIGIDFVRNTPIRSDRTYLITGGTAGLGIWLARLLAHNGAKHILLGSRRGAVTDDYARKLLRDLRISGVNATPVVLDVTDEASIASVLAEIPREFPLDGIFHGAAVMHDQPLTSVQFDKFQQVMDVKARGAYNLHIATRTMGLSYFVVLGSLAGVVGMADQVAYCAANMYLQGLVASRRRSGLSGLCLHLARVVDVGMAKRLVQDKGENMEKYLLSLGMAENTAIDVMRAISHQLSMNAPGTLPAMAIGIFDYQQFMVTGPGVSWKRIEGIAKATRDGSGQRSGWGVKAWIRGLIQGKSEMERLQVITEQIIRVSAEVLKVDASQLTEESDLKSFGLDSLSMMDMQLQMEKQLGLTINRYDMVAASGQGLSYFAVKLLDQLQVEDQQGIDDDADGVDEVVEPGAPVSETEDEGELPDWQSMDALALREYVLQKTADAPPYFRVQALAYDGEWFTCQCIATPPGKFAKPYSKHDDFTQPLQLNPPRGSDVGPVAMVECGRHQHHLGIGATLMQLPANLERHYFLSHRTKWDAHVDTAPGDTVLYAGGIVIRSRAVEVNAEEKRAVVESEVVGLGRSEEGGGAIVRTLLQSGRCEIKFVPEIQFTASFGAQRTANSWCGDSVRDPYTTVKRKVQTAKREILADGTRRLVLGKFTPDQMAGHFPHYPAMSSSALFNVVNGAILGSGRGFQIHVDKSDTLAYQLVWPGQMVEVYIKVERRGLRVFNELEVCADGQVVARQTTEAGLVFRMRKK